jgi:lipopolysaccharide transport system permease protein
MGLLARKDLVSEFRKSVIGSLWLLLLPLFNVVVWVALHAVGMFNPGEMEVPYFAFVLLSMAIWMFFFGYYRITNQLLTKHGKVFLQVRIPPEAILGELLLVQTVNMAIMMVITLVVLVIAGGTLSWGVLLFPLVVLPLVILGVAVGLVFAILRIVAFDIFTVLNRLVELLLFASPVVYAHRTNSEILQTILDWNPLTYLITSARDILIKGTLYEPVTYACCAAGSVLVLLLALRFYFIAHPRVLERVAV